MKSITPAQILPLVRKNFDEIVTNDSAMLEVLPEDNDSNNFEESLKRILPEALNAVHQNAPIEILDGESETVTPSISNGVMSFSVAKDILRLVAFKSSDSNYVLTEAVPEYSTRGRMQLNPYTVGTPDNPCLVQLQGRKTAGATNFKYYTCASNATVSSFEYIPMYKYSSTASYKCAEQVFDQLVDLVTGMMLEIYGNQQQASYFIQKGSFGTTPEVKE